MKNITFCAVVAILGACTTALAQGGPLPDPYGDATVAKADAEKTAGERFDQLDTNHDGALSADEVEAASNGRGLRRADANGDGKIDRAEYMSAQKMRFDMMDADHDNQLTKAERDAFRAQMRARMGGGPGGGWGGPPPGGEPGQ